MRSFLWNVNESSPRNFLLQKGKKYIKIQNRYTKNFCHIDDISYIFKLPRKTKKWLNLIWTMEKHVTLCTVLKISSIFAILSYLREMNLVFRQNVKIWGRAALLKPKIEGRSSAHLTVILFVELLTGGGGGCVALTFSYVASFCCWPCLRNIWDFSPSIPFYHDKLLFQFCPRVSKFLKKWYYLTHWSKISRG